MILILKSYINNFYLEIKKIIQKLYTENLIYKINII